MRVWVCGDEGHQHGSVGLVLIPMAILSLARVRILCSIGIDAMPRTPFTEGHSGAIAEIAWFLLHSLRF